MKITDVSVQVVDAGVTMLFAERLIMNLANVIVRVRTEDGIEGVAGSSTYLGAQAVAAALAELKPLLIGEDPLYRERIWQRLNEVSILMVPPHSLAIVDCALSTRSETRCSTPFVENVETIAKVVPFDRRGRAESEIRVEFSGNDWTVFAKRIGTMHCLPGVAAKMISQTDRLRARVGRGKERSVSARARCAPGRARRQFLCRAILAGDLRAQDHGAHASALRDPIL